MSTVKQNFLLNVHLEEHLGVNLKHWPSSLQMRRALIVMDTLNLVVCEI